MAIDSLNIKIQKAVWESTPTAHNVRNSMHCLLNIKLKLQRKKLRKK